MLYRTSGLGSLWALLLCASISLFGSPARRQTSATSKQTTQIGGCDQHSDRRYAVCRGAWSGKTVALFNTWSAPDINPGRRLRLSSPDRTKVIAVDAFRVRLLMGGKSYWTPFGMMHDAELGWSPDSKRLFVTWTETGELGPWHVQVYDVTQDGPREIKRVTREASKDLLARERRAPIPSGLPRGYWNSLEYCEPEIVGSQWLNGSSQILVAAIAGPDSGCKYMSDFRVYRIDVKSGRILQSYSATEAHRLFGNDDLPKILDGSKYL